MKKLLLCFAALVAFASMAIAAPNKDGTQKDQVVIPATLQAALQNPAIASPTLAVGFADMYALYTAPQTQDVFLKAEDLIAPLPSGPSSKFTAATKSEVMPLATKDTQDLKFRIYTAGMMTNIGDSGVNHIRVLPIVVGNISFDFTAGIIPAG